MKYKIPGMAPMLLILSIGLFPSNSSGQSYVSEINTNGFTLKKVVSDTVIATGQTFSYTVYFSFPAGATNITITDVLPPGLVYHAIAVTSPCGTPAISTPPAGTNGTVSLQWPAAPAGCSGSFVITVSFPNGITCDGATARNRACLAADLGGQKVDACTGFVNTRALATDPWGIGKWALGVGNQAGPCPNITADSVVSYQICVWKNVGTTGQLNLENSVVYDTLPPGAVLISSTCGMTQSGSVLTWNIGSLSALPMYNTQCCSFQVLYPRSIFPSGSQISNGATLHGTLGSLNAPCGQAKHASNQTCVEIKPVTKTNIGKYAFTNGQPGCSGKYQIWVCNNGSVPITSLTITDTIPSTLLSPALGFVSPGLSAGISGNIVTATLTGTLAPTQCLILEVNFTISPSALVGSTINNCAWVSVPGLPPSQACAAFTVIAPAPKPCLWKEVCGKQVSYKPGDTLRYRLRVQNIGGQPITGASVTDLLNPNLIYIGNPSYYSGTAWNAPCQSISNWTGVGFSQSGNALTFTLPTIPASCQNIFYSNCGMYGTPGVPYYFIEFDVKIADTSSLGNIPNQFGMAGGNLSGTTSSNIDYVNVVGTAGFTLDKGVAKDTSNWSSSATTAPSSNVNFRLRFNVAPGSVGLRHVTFADLLPRDNGTNDQLILGPCSPRGSVFDLSFSAPILTAPPASGYNNPLSFARVNNFLPVGAPGAMFAGGCGSAGSWAPGIAAGNKNLGYYFGATPLPAGSSATAVFSAAVPGAAASQDVACNTFAANAAVRHLINSSIVSDQKIGELESGAACVTVEKDSITCIRVQPQSIQTSGLDSAGNCTYTIAISVTNPAASPMPAWFSSLQGTVTPASVTFPSGTSAQTLTFTDIPPGDSFICIRFGVLDATGAPALCDSVCFDLPPCSPDPCDSISIKFGAVTTAGADVNGNCNYTVSISATNSGSTPIPVWFDSFAGTVSPASIALPVGSSTQTLTFTDTPPQNTFACIRMLLPQPGTQTRIVCDSICFDLEPCAAGKCDSLVKQTLDDCCTYQATIVNAIGTPITSISYVITGGTVNTFTTAPCAPVAPAVPGSSAGTLVYSPPCAGNIGFSIKVNPTTASNSVTVQLVIRHGDRDSCVVRFTYTCDPTPLERCDSIRAKPYFFKGMKFSGRTFTVFNTKSPASPIAWIDIIPSPTPCLMIGSGLSIDYAPAAWGAPYLRIPVSGTISAAAGVQFNLGIDYSCNWTGTITLVVHHADGDSCVYRYGPWAAKPPIDIGVLDPVPIDKRLYAAKLRLRNTGAREVKWLAVTVEDSSDIVMAGSGAQWEGTMLQPEYEPLESFEQGMSEALFGFDEAVKPGGVSKHFNLLLAADSASKTPPLIRWISYDEEGNAVATDTVRVSSTVLSVSGGAAATPEGIALLNFFPNPASNIATINYMLDRDMHVRLELYNQAGEKIGVVDEGRRARGLQSASYNTAGLPPGVYHLTLSAENGGRAVKRIMIVR